MPNAFRHSRDLVRPVWGLSSLLSVDLIYCFIQTGRSARTAKGLPEYFGREDELNELFSLASPSP